MIGDYIVYSQAQMFELNRAAEQHLLRREAEAARNEGRDEPRPSGTGRPVRRTARNTA